VGYAIGTVNKDGGDDAHLKLIDEIKTLVEANGWVTQRFTTNSTYRELIVKSLGLSGTEEIYLGIKTYQDVGADYYNITVAVMTGYVSGNSFEAQPGYFARSVPAHNNSITYFLTANAQRIVGCIKVGTPVYEHFYIGKFYPYARPGEYPSPLCLAAMLGAGSTARFSEVSHRFPYHGRTAAQLFIRSQAGAWPQPAVYPFQHASGSGSNTLAESAGECLVPAGDYYQLEPLIMMEYHSDTNPTNVWGELDGVHFVSGFNNAVENVIQMGGATVDQTGMTVAQAVSAILAVPTARAFIVCQNVTQTSWRDYVAIEMN
jgi:hypothetical protein